MYFVRAESLTKESQKLSTIQLWAKRMPKDKVNKSGRQIEDADADAFALTYLSHSIFRLQNCTWKRADAIKCGHLFDSIFAPFLLYHPITEAKRMNWFSYAQDYTWMDSPATYTKWFRSSKCYIVAFSSFKRALLVYEGKMSWYKWHKGNYLRDLMSDFSPARIRSLCLSPSLDCNFIYQSN